GGPGRTDNVRVNLDQARDTVADVVDVDAVSEIALAAIADVVLHDHVRARRDAAADVDAIGAVGVDVVLAHRGALPADEDAGDAVALVLFTDVVALDDVLGPYDTYTVAGVAEHLVGSRGVGVAGDVDTIQAVADGGAVLDEVAVALDDDAGATVTAGLV